MSSERESFVSRAHLLPPYVPPAVGIADGLKLGVLVLLLLTISAAAYAGSQDLEFFFIPFWPIVSVLGFIQFLAPFRRDRRLGWIGASAPLFWVALLVTAWNVKMSPQEAQVTFGSFILIYQWVVVSAGIYFAARALTSDVAPAFCFGTDTLFAMLPFLAILLALARLSLARAEDAGYLPKIAIASFWMLCGGAIYAVYYVIDHRRRTIAWHSGA